MLSVRAGAHRATRRSYPIPAPNIQTAAAQPRNGIAERRGGGAATLEGMLFVTGVIALNLYAAVLVVLRALVYRTRLYRPMLWNIWLSVLPVFILLAGFIAGAILMQFDPLPARVAWIATGIVWLLLLPNASYLITELNFSHREEDDPVPLWYDIVLVITLAMSGVVNTVVNVLIVHIIASIVVFGDSLDAITRPASWIAVACVLLLLGLGMYLGRYLRLNSWDVKHPIGFARKVLAHFRSWQHVLACAGFSVTYAIFLGLIYLIVGGLAIDGMSALELARSV